MAESMRVLVTRPAGQEQGLCDHIEAGGGRAIHLPAIEILPPEDTAPLAAISAVLEQFDLAVFISVNAVCHALDFILQRRDWPAGTEIAAVGPASNATLGDYGLSVDHLPRHEYSSEGLLDLEALQHMRGKRVVIFRGNGGRETLHDTLRARGAQVEYVEVYRRACPQDGGKLLRLLQQDGVDVITATSNEALQNLFDMAGAEGQPLLRHLPLVIPGHRQAELAARLGFLQGAVIAGHASDEAMAAGVKQLVSRKDEN
ncbi:MAG: uroporphyrinogen-III synthase [Gammaproteobacteria bacterium]